MLSLLNSLAWALCKTTGTFKSSFWMRVMGEEGEGKRCFILEAGEDVGGGGSGPISGVRSISLCIIGVAGLHSVIRRESGWKRWQDSIEADISERPEHLFPGLVCLNVLVGVLRQLHI